jgi:hypothetical protein
VIQCIWSTFLCLKIASQPSGDHHGQWLNADTLITECKTVTCMNSYFSLKWNGACDPHNLYDVMHFSSSWSAYRVTYSFIFAFFVFVNSRGTVHVIREMCLWDVFHFSLSYNPKSAQLWLSCAMDKHSCTYIM